MLKEKNVSLTEVFWKLPFAAKLFSAAAAVLFITAFGTYGYGYNALDFIYGGF